MADLKLLFEAILKGKQKDAVEITQQAINENIAPKELIDNYLIKAMEKSVVVLSNRKHLCPNC